jgi:hypothetical protein
MSYEKRRLARRVDANYTGVYDPNLTLISKFRTIGGEYLQEFPGYGIIHVENTKALRIREGAIIFLNFYADTDSVIGTYSDNKNLYLKPHGTGLVKFGSHTATGDVASNGHITILDAGGTTRKLMTTA